MAEDELEYFDEEPNHGAIVQHSDGQHRDVVRRSPPDGEDVSTGQFGGFQVASIPPSLGAPQFFSGAQRFGVTAGSLNNAQNVNHFTNCTWISPPSSQTAPMDNPDSPQGFEHPRRPIDNRESSHSQEDFSGAAPVRVNSTEYEQSRPEQQSRPSQSHSSQETVHRPSGQGPVPSPAQRNATSSRLSGQRIQTGATYAPPSPPPSPPTRWWSSRSPPKRSNAATCMLAR
ncbi:hypothetical protein DFH06DRAFT_72140 [Mycena polygramma]|nr:hypothetical protein DFH06DRAFT_72140 [Mycena polygramma]